MSEKFRDLLLSPYYALFIFIISAMGILLGDGALIAVMLVEAQLIALVLCLSDDLFPTLLPILSVIVLGTTLIGRMELITPWIPYAFTVIPAFVFHLVFYRKGDRLKMGASFLGVALVAVAILLSGAGNQGGTDYGDPTVRYYLLAMSVGLVLLYLLASMEARREKAYDRIRYFLLVLFGIGALCTLIVLVNFFGWIFGGTGEVNVQDYFARIPYRNTIANLLTLCLPAPFYFAGYVVKRHSAHIAIFLTGCLFYAAMLLTVARTAMLFGTVVLICCLVYYLKGKEAWYYKVASILIVTLGLVVLGCSVYEPIFKLFTSRLEDGLASLSETRWQLFLRSIEDFLEYPIFGIGFASAENADLYAADGCISWYHLYFPQIWGSLGLFGCVAFGYQLISRARIAFFRPDCGTVAVTLCYLGILLYSQTDPGEFIPIPFAALAVLMFVLLETRNERLTEQCKAPETSEGKK